MNKCDIGLIGLAVMGENLAMNMESRGFSVALYNRETEWVDCFLSGRGAGRRFTGCRDLEALVSSLKRPRKILMMVRAGAAVDELMERLLPRLEPGDMLIDGGNSNFRDTQRRLELAEGQGILYVGMGVSGGGAGALKGPCLMPGGSAAAWPHVREIFQRICARAEDGAPCCEWVGAGGAGHYVKMVHNGIEYGDMQLIGEVYHLMRELLGLDADEMSAVFRVWNETELRSYLIEITGKILARKDGDGAPLVDKILDAAGQKGTGKWTAIEALDAGVPLTLITEAVFARSLSAMKEERIAAAGLLHVERAAFSGDREGFLEDLRRALFASRIVCYAQGCALMDGAAQNHGWKIDCGSMARIWRGGCIIRSSILEKISAAYRENPALENLMLAPAFAQALRDALPAWRRVAAEAIRCGVPVPAMSAALAYFDGCTSPRLPANLLQAQRDYFGAHTYERTDAPRGRFFHTDWTGEGGETVSGSYNA